MGGTVESQSLKDRDGDGCAAHPANPEQAGRNSHHPLEHFLAKPIVRRLLAAATATNGAGECFFERLCRHYNNPAKSLWERWKWFIPGRLIDFVLWRTGLDKQHMTEKLFHHQPTVRALALTGRSIARYGLGTPQRFAAPLMIVWNITQACNLRCSHCYQSATPKPAADELSLDEKLAAVDQMGAAGVPFLAIAGGEPLTTRHLWPVLERARQRRIHTTLATNGTLLTAENAARLKEAGVKYVDVSVDSLAADEHDRFRGRNGAWEKAIRGIRNSVEAGIRTGFATCFTRNTVEKVDEVVEFAISLGCRTFSHFNFIPVGRGAEMLDEDLTPTQREWLLRRLVAHLQEGRIGVISTAPQLGRSCVAYAPPEGIFATGHAGSGPGGKTKVLSRYIGGCGAGRCYCALQPNGDITPCVYISSRRVGSLKEQTIEEIWKCPLFDVLSDRSDRRHHCVVCDYRAYCGGCRARALAYTDDIRAGDPGCRNNRDLWDSLVAANHCSQCASEDAEVSGQLGTR